MTNLKMNSNTAGRKQTWVHIACLLVISVLCYGLSARSIGFHWDDFGTILVKYFYGTGVQQYFAGLDRPGLKITYGIVPSIIGFSFFRWAIFILLEWWTCSVLLYIFLKKLLPQAPHYAIWTSLLFVVYPAFNSMSVTVIYGMMFIQLIMILLSYNLMERYIHGAKFKLFYYGLSILLTLQIFLSEYWFGMEVCRILFILILVSGQVNIRKMVAVKNILKSILIYLPYAAVTIFFLIWRLFIFKSVRPETDQEAILGRIGSNFILEMAGRVKLLLSDFFITGFFSWIHSFGDWFYDFNTGYLLHVWLVFLVAFLIIFIIYKKLPGNKPEDQKMINSQDVNILMMVMGLIVIFISQAPVNFTGYNIRFDNLSGRFALPSVFGSCIFFGGFMSFAFREKKSHLIAAALIISAGAAYQFRNGLVFKGEQQYHKDLFYQLAWRAPYLEKGTVMETDIIPTVNRADMGYTLSEITFGIYGPNPDFKGDQNYWVVKNNTADKYPLVRDIEMKRNAYGFFKFKGSYNKSLALWKPVDGCLRIVDTTNADYIDISPSTALAAKLTNTSVIKSNLPSNVNPDFLNVLFGRQDTTCWCYYFEKAELARQGKDWISVKAWIDRAIAKKLNPENPTEWITYLEACLHLRRFNEVSDLLNKFNEKISATCAYNMLLKFNSSVPAADRPQISRLMEKFRSRVQLKKN